MKKLLWMAVVLIHFQTNGQGKFFGGDGPSAYSGSSMTVGPLPVRLISFDGISTEQGIRLNWQTASELNNDFFQLEKLENDQFRYLKKIAGGGTTTDVTNYSTLDESPSDGLNIYRLSQTDFDGTHEFLKTIQVVFFSVEPELYPNPTRGSIALNKHFEGGQLSIFDVNGTLVMKVGSDEGINIADQPAGIYIVKVSFGKKSFIRRLLKQ